MRQTYVHATAVYNWRRCHTHTQGERVPRPAREKDAIEQLCGLLPAADMRLAAAAASGIASFFFQEKEPCVGAPCYYVLSDHMRDVGAVLGNAAAVAEVFATGPQFAVARLTLAAATASWARHDPKRLQATASMLLPGLLPALVLVCTDQNRG
jgi:hypothetical protein